MNVNEAFSESLLAYAENFNGNVETMKGYFRIDGMDDRLKEEYTVVAETYQQLINGLKPTYWCLDYAYGEDVDYNSEIYEKAQGSRTAGKVCMGVAAVTGMIWLISFLYAQNKKDEILQ